MNVKIEPVKVTELEAELLRYIEDADHSSDGHGLQGYIYKEDLDMNKFRGVISSLVKKGIIETEIIEVNFEKYLWASVKSDFQKKDEEAYNEWVFDNIVFP